MELENLKIELIKNQAIQKYLLEHGSNDEFINDKIRTIQYELLEIEKNRNRNTVEYSFETGV